MLAEAYKFEKPCPEVNVTPEVRQEGYEAFVTTDDHLMHLTGITKDQKFLGYRTQYIWRLSEYVRKLCTCQDYFPHGA